MLSAEEVEPLLAEIVHAGETFEHPHTRAGQPGQGERRESATEVRLDGDEMPADADDGDAGHASAAYIISQGFDIRPGGRHHRLVATDGLGPRAHRSSLGYAIVLLGAALFMASCFLPYTGYMVLPPAPRQTMTISLYQQLTEGLLGGGSDLGALLYLFGGVAPVAAVAVVALVRGERRPVMSALLVGAVVAWSLTWIGALLRLGTFLDASLEIGFWLQAVSIGVAVIGTILVATHRTGAHEHGAASLGV